MRLLQPPLILKVSIEICRIGGVISGQHAIQSSKEAAGQTESVFGKISINTDKVLQQAQSVQQMIEKVREESSSFINEITTVASITEQTAASVEEVLASAEEQGQRIDEVVTSFRNLEKLTETLNRLTQAK